MIAVRNILKFTNIDDASYILKLYYRLFMPCLRWTILGIRQAAEERQSLALKDPNDGVSYGSNGGAKAKHLKEFQHRRV